MTVKTGLFVRELSNVERFLAGVKVAQARGAREASWVLNKSEPGYGKTKTLEWYATQKPCAYVRAKADWTPNWLLYDLAQALGVKPFQSTKDLFNAVLAEILKQQDQNDEFSLIVDELDHAARSIRVLETLRDLTDFAEVPLIAGGMKGIDAQLKRYPQIYSRIAKVVQFAPASVADVRTLCDALSDAKIADDMIEAIQTRTQGRLRSIMQAVVYVDSAYRKSREKVTVENFGRRALLNDERGEDV